MIALSFALAFIASLAFVAFLLVRKDRFREDVRDQVVKAVQLTKALKHEVDTGRKGWDAAAQYVEAKHVEQGIRGIGRS